MALRKLLLISSLLIVGNCFGQSPMFKLISKKVSAEQDTISFVSHVSAAGASTATTSSINSTGVNLIVIGITSYNTFPTVSDSYSNTWTQLSSSTASSLAKCRLFYCINPTVGSGHTFSFSSSNTYSTINVLAFSNATGYVSENTANGNSPLGPSVTPTNNNSLVVSSLAYDNNGTSTVSGSFTKYDVLRSAGVNIYGGIAYYIQPTAASIACTWTFTSPGATSVAVFY